MPTNHRLLAVLISFLTGVSKYVQSAPSARAPAAIVLVHGVLIDGSSWRGVYDVLTRDGFRVSIVQEPLTGLDEDVAATQRVLDQ